MKGKFTTAERAAEIIRKFATDRTDDPYEWDDFETQNEENPVVDLAIRLCWHFAARFPGSNEREYCGPEAVPWFLAVANALEKRLLSDVDYEVAKKSLEHNELPQSLAHALEQASSH